MVAEPFSAHPKGLWTEETGIPAPEAGGCPDESLKSRLFDLHEKRTSGTTANCRYFESMSIKKSVRAVSLLIVGVGLTVNGYSQSFLTNGLVAYYPFNGNANDASENGHNGTVNGAVLANDRFGSPNGAYLFDGGTARIVVPDSQGLNPGTADFTVCLWAWSDAWRSTTYMLAKYPIIGKSAYGMGTGFPAGSYVFVKDIQTTTTVGSEVQGRPLSNGQWYSLIMSWRRASCLSLYVNGKLDAVNTNILSNSQAIQNTGPMTIGGLASGQAFNGVIDDVRIYNRALSSNEVAQLYALEATPPTGFETNGLVAYYPFDGSADDVSGNANNGTVHGAILTTDRFGTQERAMAFNGIDQYVEAPHQDYLNFPAGDFTVTFWAAVNDLSRLQYFVGKDMGQGINNKWITLYSPNPSFLGFGFFINGPAYAFANVSPAPGTWHQFMYRKSSTQYTVHFDGVQVSSSQGPATLRSDNTAPLRIGQCEGGGYVFGKLDDVRIYNRALSDIEVAQLYGLESGPGVDLVKAVKPCFSYLRAGTNYQLQVSSDMTNWINQGAPFTATNRSMVYPQYFDVPYWGNLFFRLH